MPESEIKSLEQIEYEYWIARCDMVVERNHAVPKEMYIALGQAAYALAKVEQ